MVVEKIFGSKVKVQLLKFLLHSQKGYTLRELATELGCDHKTVGVAVNDFKEVGLVSVNQYGRSYAVILQKDHPLLPTLRTLYLSEEE